MIQFYSPDIAQTWALPESDSKHAVRVLRMVQGDTLQVIDGKGHVYTCRLADADPHCATVEVMDVQEQPLPWRQKLVVAVAPTKHNDRMEWMVEKLTEVGVDRIIPLLCRHSERKEIKVERLEKIAIAAMKQSLKAYCPAISPMTPFKEVVASFSDYDRYIAHCVASGERVDFSRAYRPGQNTAILIGPEGDFDDVEISTALDNRWLPVTFGQNRLRTETAALYGITACHVLDNAR